MAKPKVVKSNPAVELEAKNVVIAEKEAEISELNKSLRDLKLRLNLVKSRAREEHEKAVEHVTLLHQVSRIIPVGILQVIRDNPEVYF